MWRHFSCTPVFFVIPRRHGPVSLIYAKRWSKPHSFHVPDGQTGDDAWIGITGRPLLNGSVTITSSRFYSSVYTLFLFRDFIKEKEELNKNNSLSFCQTVSKRYIPCLWLFLSWASIADPTLVNISLLVMLHFLTFLQVSLLSRHYPLMLQ